MKKKPPEFLTSERYDSYSVSLRFLGKKLDFDKIEEALALKPTTITKKGDVNNKFRRSAKLDVWIYQARNRTTEPLSKHLAALLGKLQSKQAVLRRLARKYQGEVYCSYLSDLAQGGFGITPHILQSISECGLSLSFSIFSWGGVLKNDRKPRPRKRGGRPRGKQLG